MTPPSCCPGTAHIGNRGHARHHLAAVDDGRASVSVRAAVGQDSGAALGDAAKSGDHSFEGVILGAVGHRYAARRNNGSSQVGDGGGIKSSVIKLHLGTVKINAHHAVREPVGRGADVPSAIDCASPDVIRNGGDI